MQVNFDNNRFRELPEALFDIPNLEKISMNHNQITKASFNMWSAPKLTDLSLAHNKLAELPHSPPGDATSTNGGPDRSTTLRERRSVSYIKVTQ